MKKIDFVILWVDGADKKWLEEKKHYKPDIEVDDCINRYRDWDLLKYWFRGVERYAPWVNHIFFITYGHLPPFLNVNHPKITIVNHKDFIPKYCLPTYNSNAIELNIANIKELGEQFVLFNDDMYLTSDVDENDFFLNGKPRDDYAENIILANNDMIQYNLLNNTNIVNKYYNKKEVYKKSFFKYYNLKYGVNNFRTLLLSPYNNFAGFYYNHLPQSFIKKYFDWIWEKEPDLCQKTIESKFRNKDNITQWLIKVVQMMDGNFIPRSHKFGKYFDLKNNNMELTNCIKKNKYKMICINDSDETIDFKNVQKELIEAFETILPEKSSYEK